MVKLFFLYSGEHKTLPIAEIQAILTVENYNYQIQENLTQVLRLDTDVNCVESIEFRSALTRICCKEIFTCEANSSAILSNMNSCCLEDFINADEDFAVRIRRIKGVSPELNRVNLERQLGKKIIELSKNTKVCLSKPQKMFIGILTDNQFLFGLRIANINTKPFSERRPRKRPFFHPTAMPAKLARTMVNLAQPKENDLVLDPFCGSSGMLVEAGLIRCRVVGFDAKLHMLKGGLKNLLHYGITPEGVVLADARFPPITKIDCVVTDPPYGRSASTLGMKTIRIVDDFLSNIGDLLPKSGKICIASPKSIQISELGEKIGLKHLESHFVYVHRSLTREIVVFENT